MSHYKTFKKKLLKIDSGSLNSRITIYVRQIQPPTAGQVEFDEKFLPKIDVWALIEPVTGLTVFDSVNVERIVTHKFYIRYIPNITFQNWLEYKGQKYSIASHQVINVTERVKFYLILTEFRGDTTKPVTHT